jgi:hypothetical protein
MSVIYELDLFHNMLDSLNESISYYKKAIDDESKYKFCIILLSHFMELSLKYLVEKQNPILVYEKPYSEKLIKEKTITWGQALQILRNCKIEIDENIKKHFDELALLRNDIIHYKFSYETENIRNIVVNIVTDVRSIFIKAQLDDFYIKTTEETQALLNEIKDEYSRELHLAQANAIENANGEKILDCDICGEEKTVNLIDGVFHCNFCNEDNSYVDCVRCGDSILESESIHYGETEDGDPIYLCEYCDGVVNDD